MFYLRDFFQIYGEKLKRVTIRLKQGIKKSSRYFVGLCMDKNRYQFQANHHMCILSNILESGQLSIGPNSFQTTKSFVMIAHILRKTGKR
mgnify:CR=1 FL=1